MFENLLQTILDLHANIFHGWALGVGGNYSTTTTTDSVMIALGLRSWGADRKHILCLIVAHRIKLLHHQAKNNKFYANGIGRKSGAEKKNEFE